MKIHYKLTAAVSVEERHAQMGESLKTGYPRIKPSPIDDALSLSIVCYGPSLEDTWREITRPILTVSGALHYLAERGIVPDYHVDVDPRQHKVRHVIPPVDGVHYIIGSCCHPSIWAALEGQKVSILHVYSDKTTQEWIAKNDPGEGMIHAGSTVGLTAIHVGGLLGRRHFEIHGMDGCIRNGKRHAGPHYGHSQGGVTWQAGNVVYETSKIMSNACAEVINTLRLFPIFAVFHGHGLQQALLAEEPDLTNVALAGTDKADRVRAARIVHMEPMKKAA